jgi:hypothetical protein
MLSHVAELVMESFHDYISEFVSVENANHVLDRLT